MLFQANPLSHAQRIPGSGSVFTGMSKKYFSGADAWPWMLGEWASNQNNKGPRCQDLKIRIRTSTALGSLEESSGPDKALGLAVRVWSLERRVKLESGLKRSQETLGS